jgi:3D (Asp-Asp-Asp) domain-containing protein
VRVDWPWPVVRGAGFEFDAAGRLCYGTPSRRTKCSDGDRTSAQSLVPSALLRFTSARMRTTRLQTAPAGVPAFRRFVATFPLGPADVQKRSSAIGRDRKSPVAVSVLSLSLLLPLGAGAFPDRAIALLADASGRSPAKHVLFIDGPAHNEVETRTTTVEGFLRERGIAPGPDDRLSSPPGSAVIDGSTIAYRAAVPVDIVADGTTRSLRSAAETVGDALRAEGFAPGPHDSVAPSVQTALTAGTVIHFSRATSWLEKVRSAIAPPVRHKYDIGMTNGSQQVVDPGAPGMKEATIEVLQPNRSAAPKRLLLADRVLRFPRAKVVAEGVGDYSALASMARRGMTGTRRLADSALRMVATAYTASCAGCSGTTASGHSAGHGIVAVDPQYIPLGTHLYIPGYGRALAGDTGGAIRGNRIDLGFESHRDAMSFGRRPIVVYVLK